MRFYKRCLLMCCLMVVVGGRGYGEDWKEVISSEHQVKYESASFVDYLKDMVNEQNLEALKKLFSSEDVTAKFARGEERINGDILLSDDVSLLWYLVINTRYYFNTPKIMKLLIEKGANVNRKGGSDDSTILHYLVRLGDRENNELSKILIENKADLTAKTRTGEIPFDIAKQKEKWAIAVLFATNSNDKINIADSAFRRLISNGYDICNRFILRKDRLERVLKPGVFKIFRYGWQNYWFERDPLHWGLGNAIKEEKEERNKDLWEYAKNIKKVVDSIKYCLKKGTIENENLRQSAENIIKDAKNRFVSLNSDEETQKKFEKDFIKPIESLVKDLNQDE